MEATGQDNLQGGIGNDTLNGGDGFDFILGQDDNDIIFSNDGGFDIVDAGPGATDNCTSDAIDTI